MKLKAKLLLLVISVALGVSVFTTANAWVGSRVNASVQEGVVRQHIVRDLFELNIITYEYLRIRGERPQAQWEQVYNDVSEDIGQLNAKDKRESASIERLRQNLEKVRRLFSKVTDDELIANDALRNSLVTQLFSTTHSMATAAATLSERSISDAHDQGRQTVLIMLSSGLFLTALLTTIAFSIASSLGRAVYKLKAGVTAFSTGNLSHVVDVRSKDELAELGESFNQMAVRLRKSYDSLRRENAERQRAGEELAKANEALEQQVIERTRSEEALRESQERLDAILDGAHDAIISVGADNCIRVFNRGAERIFGYRADEITGEPLDVLLPQRFAESHREHLRSFIEDENSAVSAAMNDRGIVFGLRKDGTEFPAEASISKTVVKGEIICTATVRDVSERVQDQEELAHRAGDLARSNADLEQFAYVASHDLQEPLRSIAGFSKLLTRRYQGRLDEDADGLIKRISDSTTRMQVLILDLLAYSRVGKDIDKFAPTDCDPIVDAEIDNLQAVIEETGATVIHDPLPAVIGHASLLSQLFRNLISNAIKFHGEEPSRIHISAEQLHDEWVFSVRDNGIGVDPEYAEQIFTIFQRLHSQDEYPGTGIGLAVCKKVVNRLGGRIWVDSHEGKGTTFFFTVPIPGNKEAMVADSAVTLSS